MGNNRNGQSSAGGDKLVVLLGVCSLVWWIIECCGAKEEFTVRAEVCSIFIAENH